MPSLRRVVWKVDPGQAIYRTASVDELVSDTLAARRFQLALLGGFSVTGLLLAAIGVYGLISATTRQRSREIGIRIAVGAHRAEVAMMILRQGARLGGAGIVLGVGLALLLTRFLEHMLFAVTPTDPGTFLSLAGFMLMLVLAATWLPATRAARLDPIRALRGD